MSRAPRNVAFNPLPWAVTAKGFDFESMPSISEILNAIRDSGFESVHSEIPNGSDEESYRAALRESQLQPAPGYFQANFANSEDFENILKLATEAARFHKRLGLDRIFIADSFGSEPARIAAPAVGANPDSSRLMRVADALDRVANAMAAEGVKPCLHPHVGTMIETEDEIEFVLSATGENLLFGPDTGHLTWAGMDPAKVISRHQSRIGAVHIKDVHSAVAESNPTSNYLEKMLAHVWTEPGRGNVDFDSVFKALDGFDGWYVIEVDYSDLGAPEKSALASAEWASLNAERFAGK